MSSDYDDFVQVVLGNLNLRWGGGEIEVRIINENFLQKVIAKLNS